VLALREHCGESQRHFARTLGIGFRTLQYIEAGQIQRPDSKSLFAFFICALDRSRTDLATVFERELIAAMDPPVGVSVQIVLKPPKGKRL